MIPTSLRTRGVAFAFLFGPPRTLSRQEGSAVHDAICRALGVDDIAFRYSTATEDGDPAAPDDRSRGFSIQFERTQGRGSLKFLLDNTSVDNPIRFLTEYTWPPSREHMYQDIDMATEAVFEVLGREWQRVLAEARIKGQLEARGASAVEFLATDVLGLDESRKAALDASLSFVTVGYETAAGSPTEVDQLRRPKREFKMEVLREDDRSLYVELMSQWPQLAPTATGAIEIDAKRIRHFDVPPSVYLKNSIQYLSDVALPLFMASPTAEEE